MTADATGIGKLTEAARQILERYLWELRLSLQGCRSVNAAEVEADVKQHIDHELSEQPAPVSPEQLDLVLKKLGSPQQWVPEEELSWWRRIVLKLRTGPHDVRLPAAVFAMMVLGLIFVPLTWPFLLGSFILARAVMAMFADEEKELGWQRWLIYPPLLVFYIPIAGFLLGWPACAGALAEELSRDQRTTNPFTGQMWALMPNVTFPLAAGATALAAWWTLVALVLLIWPSMFKGLLRPFVGRVSRVKSSLAILVCLILFATSGVILSRLVNTVYPEPQKPAPVRYYDF